MIDCPGARFTRNRSGDDYLEFAETKTFVSRYDGESFIPRGVRVTVDPDFKIEMF